jgi:hypothetical protein
LLAAGSKTVRDGYMMEVAFLMVRTGLRISKVEEGPSSWTGMWGLFSQCCMCTVDNAAMHDVQDVELCHAVLPQA